MSCFWSGHKFKIVGKVNAVSDVNHSKLLGFYVYSKCKVCGKKMCEEKTQEYTRIIPNPEINAQLAINVGHTDEWLKEFAKED